MQPQGQLPQEEKRTKAEDRQYSTEEMLAKLDRDMDHENLKRNELRQTVQEMKDWFTQEIAEDRKG